MLKLISTGSRYKFLLTCSNNLITFYRQSVLPVFVDVVRHYTMVAIAQQGTYL